MESQGQGSQDSGRKGSILKTDGHKHLPSDHVKFDKVIIADVELPSEEGQEAGEEDQHMVDEEVKEHHRNLTKQSSDTQIHIEKELTVDEQERLDNEDEEQKSKYNV